MFGSNGKQVEVYLAPLAKTVQNRTPGGVERIAHSLITFITDVGVARLPLIETIVVLQN